jgi:hypothetical protein
VIRNPLPDPVPVPNLPVIGNRPSESVSCADWLDNGIGLSSGADLSLSVCCRPGRYIRSEIRCVPLGLRHSMKG